MIRYDSYEAKLNFKKLMTQIANGEEIIIVRSGQDFAKITPLRKKTLKRMAGVDKDQAWVDDDFNESVHHGLIEMSFNPGKGSKK